jgi:membrane protein YqaA with SNARE-associated domain
MAAFVGGSSLVVQIPYTLPLLLIALNGTSLEYMLLLGITAGLGSATGKLVAYRLADTLIARKPAIQQSRYFKSISHLAQRYPHAIPLAVFFVIATPIPDETAIIPMATIKYGIRRLLLPIYLGKVAHNVVVASLFYHFTEFSMARLQGSIHAFGLSLLILAGLGLVFSQWRSTNTQNTYPIGATDPG